MSTNHASTTDSERGDADELGMRTAQEYDVSPARDLRSALSRAARFLGVTVITAGLGQVLIFVFFAVLGWQAVIANGVAVVAVAVVGFFLSLTYVWTESAAHSRTVQAAAFLVTAIFGLVISTLTVRFVTARVDHVLAANIGSFLGYGVAWVLRFALLDRVIFKVGEAATQ